MVVRKKKKEKLLLYNFHFIFDCADKRTHEKKDKRLDKDKNKETRIFSDERMGCFQLDITTVTFHGPSPTLKSEIRNGRMKRSIGT